MHDLSENARALLTSSWALRARNVDEIAAANGKAAAAELVAACLAEWRDRYLVLTPHGAELGAVLCGERASGEA